MSNTIDRLQRGVRRRIQLAIVMAAGMILLVGVFILHPEYSRAAEAGAEVRRLERESGSIEITESRLAALELERDRRYEIEQSQLRDIPRGGDEAGLADALALNVDDGGASSWSVRLLEPEPVETEKAPDNWMTLPAVIEMQGRFGAVVQALRRVENSDRLVRVRMIRVGRPRSRSGSSDAIDATVELDTVFALEGEK